MVEKRDRMIYIIADDLTGANDTGVQFSKNGFKTGVLLFQKTHHLPQHRDTDVLVIDTETRNAPPEDSRRTVRQMIESLHCEWDDTIYKKVDSTLRGNIGEEIEEIMDCLDKKICLFSPTFPKNRRTTEDGSLKVDGKPVSLTEFTETESGQQPVDSISELLSRQTTIPVIHIPLNAVKRRDGSILTAIMNGVQQTTNGNGSRTIVVVDSTEDIDLLSLVVETVPLHQSVLFSGSAGLAEQLAHYCRNREGVKRPIPSVHDQAGPSPIFCVMGSRKKIGSIQVDYVKRRVPITDLSIDLQEVITDPNAAIRDYTARAGESLKEGRSVVLRIVEKSAGNGGGSVAQDAVPHQTIGEYTIDFRQLEIRIREFISSLTAAVYKRVSFDTLIVVGGDTAFGICTALDITYMDVIREVLPGIPLVKTEIHGNPVHMITKSGGFGEQQSLYTMFSSLVGQKSCSKIDSI